jgi:hypothetical protein
MKAATLCSYPDFMKGGLGIDHNDTAISKLNGDDVAALARHIQIKVKAVIGGL